MKSNCGSSVIKCDQKIRRQVEAMSLEQVLMCGVVYLWQDVIRSIGENLHCLIALTLWFMPFSECNRNRIRRGRFGLNFPVYANARNAIPLPFFRIAKIDETHFFINCVHFAASNKLTGDFIFLHNLLVSPFTIIATPQRICKTIEEKCKVFHFFQH